MVHFVAIPEGLARVFILLDFIKVCQAALKSRSVVLLQPNATNAIHSMYVPQWIAALNGSAT